MKHVDRLCLTVADMAQTTSLSLIPLALRFDRSDQRITFHQQTGIRIDLYAMNRERVTSSGSTSS
jgi:hypothetical protein